MTAADAAFWSPAESVDDEIEATSPAKPMPSARVLDMSTEEIGRSEGYVTIEIEIKSASANHVAEDWSPRG